MTKGSINPSLLHPGIESISPWWGLTRSIMYAPSIQMYLLHMFVVACLTDQLHIAVVHLLVVSVVWVVHPAPGAGMGSLDE